MAGREEQFWLSFAKRHCRSINILTLHPFIYSINIIKHTQIFNFFIINEKMIMNNSIIGDAGSKPGKKGPLGNSAAAAAASASPESFNVFQSLVIDENFWDSQFTEHYVQGMNASNGLGNDAYIEFNTLGWSRADEISLTVPIKLTYNYRQCANQKGSWDETTGAYRHYMTVPNFTDPANSPALYFSKKRLMGAYHSQFAMLDVFNKIKVLVGNNLVNVQKNIETTPIGMKHIMLNHKFGPVVGKMMSYWGLQYNTISRPSMLNYTRTVTNNSIIIQHNFDPSLTQHDDAYLTSINKDPLASNYCDFLHNTTANFLLDPSVEILAAESTETLTSNAQTGLMPRIYNEFSVVREIVLPLQCIINFFRGPRWLPPDFRIKMLIEKSLRDNFLCYSSPIGQSYGVLFDKLPLWVTTPSNEYFRPPMYPIGVSAFGHRDFYNGSIEQTRCNAFLAAYNSDNDIGTKRPVNVLNDAVTVGVQTPRTEYDYGCLPQMEICERNGSFNTDFYIKAELLVDNLRVIYSSHTLKAPLQGRMMQFWLNQPFLYNYEATETYEIQTLDGQRNVHCDVVISAQRPTTLYFQLLAVDDYRWGDRFRKELLSDRMYRAYNLIRGSFDNQTLQAPLPLFGGIGSFQKVVDYFYIPTDIRQTIRDQYVNMCQSSDITQQNSVMTWSNFDIRFSGRTAYRFRNDKIKNARFGQPNPTAYDYITGCNLDKSYRSYCPESITLGYDTVNELFGNEIIQNSAVNPYILKCIIQPGGMVERGVITEKQGATTIQISIDFNLPLSSTVRLMMYRTNPEQLVYDSDKTATLIQWPAIADKNGYIVPNITLAP